jgi:hypothetical protein
METCDRTLEGLFGQKRIKDEIMQYALSIATNLVRRDVFHNQKVSNFQFPHAVLAGPAGTGKTTFARTLYKIIKDLRVLSGEAGDFHWVEAQREVSLDYTESGRHCSPYSPRLCSSSGLGGGGHWRNSDQNQEGAGLGNARDAVR